jgi:hypothetical protein
MLQRTNDDLGRMRHEKERLPRNVTFRALVTQELAEKLEA